ncbi:hypothetical protein JOC94_002229 [Bacillus thermophilus]|uniref:Phospholipase A2-like domain-containing protein n=2 Tax=Bacillaceae TaxID=186817 RepID=A0ABS2R6F4_9BACI|nr:hypothetical protein [Siminovitchia thermophila]
MRRAMRRSRGLCIFPGYNWCGPGCSGPGAPVNDVDACCMRHDYCLQNNIHPCICDDEFMHCLKPKIEPYTQKGRASALMYNFMRLKTAFFCG